MPDVRAGAAREPALYILTDIVTSNVSKGLNPFLALALKNCI